VRRKLFGVGVYTPRVKRGVQKPRSHSPDKSGRYVWQVGTSYLSVEWRKHTGFYPVSFFRLVSGKAVEQRMYSDVGGKTVKKWSAGAPPGKPEDVVPVACAVLKKFPRILAFLTDRWYDDGSPRFPGSVWMDSDLGACKALLKEPSLMLCARIRAATWDDLYAAVETFLGLDAPPWEPDQYAAERANQKKKK
jgi:hypothetical protein